MPDRTVRFAHGPRSATKPNLTRFKRAMIGLEADTPVKMATLLGYNETSIRRLLNGDHMVSLDLFKALKRHVGLVEALLICNLASADELANLRELQAA